jgi:hypothetical protein
METVMGSRKWTGKKGVQCAECDLWLDSNTDNKTPPHKPKGDILSSRDCPGTKKRPKNSKGFDGKKYPNAIPWKDRKK